MTAKYWRPPPDPGDIVDCRFPQTVGVPGPKERPALVLQVEEAADDPNGFVVVVAYATSQKTSSVYPGELVIAADAQNGLTAGTKFDLLNHRRLPFDDAWFGPAARSKPPHPKRGRLDLANLALKRKLQAAWWKRKSCDAKNGNKVLESLGKAIHAYMPAIILGRRPAQDSAAPIP